MGSFQIFCEEAIVTADRAKWYDFEIGKPVVVEGYHGSPDIRFIKSGEGFRSRKEWMGLGKADHLHWFTNDYHTASTYADDHRAFDYQNAEAGVVKAVLTFDNPMVVDGNGKHWREVQKMKGTGADNIIEKARSEGYDGVIITNVYDTYNTNPGDATKSKKKVKPAVTYAAFYPEMIKVVK